MKNKQKTILVTGASRGIGRAITERLIKDGYHVLMIARDKKSLFKAHQEISTAHTTTAELDLGDLKAVKQYTKQYQGTLYAIVNNAGICKIAGLAEDTDPWEEVLNTNLNGLYYLTRGLIKSVEANGRIVNISSQLGKDGRARYGAYTASKFAVIGLTKVWAKELGEKGITVNAVCPGWVKTAMAIVDARRLAVERGLSEEDYYRAIAEPLELKRFNTPEEVASLVAYLISPEAGGISGRDFLMQTIWNQE